MSCKYIQNDSLAKIKSLGESFTVHGYIIMFALATFLYLLMFF